MTAETALSLPAHEADCLAALRIGAEIKSRIAIAAGLTLRQTESALNALADKGLATRSTDGPGRAPRWAPSPDGAIATILPCDEKVSGKAKRERRAPEGTAMTRLLAILEHPMHLKALAKRLGVSAQATHMTLVRLHARGLIRAADPAQPTRWVARAEDPYPLLARSDEAVLCALPDTRDTTIRNIARCTRLTDAAALATLRRLCDLGLAEATPGPQLFRLTPSGAAHLQRDPTENRAKPASPPVRSERIFTVLNWLKQHGPTRGFMIGQALDIERSSANALMQYLKRLGLIEKTAPDMQAPFSLTDEGLRVLAQMNEAHETRPARLSSGSY